MKSELIENNGLKKKLKIEVSPEEVNKALEKEFTKIQSTLHLKGFRKGKAPISQIKTLYGGEASQKVLEHLVNENYISALKQHELTPVVMPEIDVDQNSASDVGQEGGFSFTAEFEVRPEIELKDLSEIKVTETTPNVTEEEINLEIEKARESKAEVTQVFDDRPAKENDWVKIDFQGFMMPSGDPLENGTAKDFLLELGSSSLIPGFEDGIMGMRPGDEKTLSLSFPDDYFQKEIAGQKVDFKVKLNSINKKDLPELNDEFAKEASGLDTLKAFKDQIKNRLLEQASQKSKTDLNNALLTEFERIHEIQVPEKIVKEQAENFKQTTAQRLKQQGMSDAEIAEYNAKWSENYEKDALKGVKTSFLVEALASKEKLYPTADDISEYFADLSSKTGIAMEKITEYYGGKEKMNELEFKLMEEKVVNFLKDKATVEKA